MKISKDYVKVETVKITDDYPPGVSPFISYGIHRTLTDSLISVSSKRGKMNYSLSVLLDMIFCESKNWRVDFPMKRGLIDIEKCKPNSPYYHFVVFIQQIRKCIDERHSSARCRGSRRGFAFGWDRKGGVELTDYDIRFLKNITTTSGRENKNSNYSVDSIYGLSKDITVEYLKYIKHMIQENKGLVKQTNYMYLYDTKVVHKYLWRCNDYLKKKEIMELYNLYKVRSPRSLFNFNYFNNTSITITHIEEKYFSSFARTLKKKWCSSKWPHLDRLFIAKCRLSFTKNEGLCYDINEKIMKEFQKILYQI
tara:strand:+ start:678 stop:1604 length:927 start_codon:yes stop_codon:yes gene_type:complete